MKLFLYQVDAFTNHLFGGNPAAVVPLSKWIDDTLMQQLAMENNLAETVFFAPSKHKEADFDIRWFTPELEMNLCGHATLASAFVLFELIEFNKPIVTFHSQSGLLKIAKNGDVYEMDFPSWKPERTDQFPEKIAEILGIKKMVGTYKYRDLLIEVNSEEDVVNAKPNFTALKETGEMIILTAPGKEADFVSRFFAPDAAVDEDPVTGSAHSQLIPFWSEKLGRKKMFAKQLSKRGGEIWCEQLNEQRVMIAGNCVFYMKGELEV